ncbi:hypothetical protein AB0L75_44365, partial [Streptomyces sp. NPDC052101]
MADSRRTAETARVGAGPRVVDWLLHPVVPGGALVRVAVAVLAVAFTLADRTFYEGETDLLHAAVAGGVYLPVLALALSVRASALIWVLLAAASLVVLPGSLSQLVGVAFVGVVLNGVLTFALTAREWGVFWALFS